MEDNSKSYSWLDKIINPLAKMSQFRAVKAITAAGMASIPFTIVGSMFLVLNVLPQTFTGLTGFFNNTFYRISDLYMLANYCTMGILALYFCAVIGYEYTKIYADEEELNLNPLNGALLSIFAFFMTIPELVLQDGHMIYASGSNIINGWEVGNGLTRLGTSGIFTGILMAILTVQLYRMCVKRNWVIKMPDVVPEGVSRSFTALIPAFVIALVVLVINGILVALGTDIFKVIALPFGFVSRIAGSWGGLMVIYFLISALWFVGIHGASIIGALTTPIFLNNMQLNIEGANLPFAGQFHNAYVTGGSGATLGLTLFLLFMARSDQLKILGKAEIGCAIFNINEPIIFGLPIIYNPYLLIPFFLAPMASASVGYFGIKLGFASPMIATVPWPTPVGISAFIGTAGDYRAAILSVLCAVVAFLIYLPFIRRYDKKLYAEEQANAKAAKQEA